MICFGRISRTKGICGIACPLAKWFIVGVLYGFSGGLLLFLPVFRWSGLGRGGQVLLVLYSSVNRYLYRIHKILVFEEFFVKTTCIFLSFVVR